MRKRVSYAYTHVCYACVINITRMRCKTERSEMVRRNKRCVQKASTTSSKGRTSTETYVDILALKNSMLVHCS